MAYQQDLTTGNLAKTLLAFATPFVLANFLQAFYGAADLFIVGNFCDKSAISAVATGSQIMQMLIFFITGLTTSATILIGRAFGAKQYENIEKIINTMVIFFVIIAIFLTALLMTFDDLIMNLLQTPKEALVGTLQYTFVCACGIIFIFSYNAISAVLRGVGNSIAPMYFIAIACILNVIGDLLLIGIFHMGPLGAAVATVASQAISVILGIIYIKKGDFVFDFKFRQISFDMKTAKDILTIGLPLSIQDTLIPLSFLFLLSIANSMGVAHSAAYGTVARLNAFMMLPASSFSMALVAITSQNIGANKYERAQNCLYLAITYAMIFGIIFLLWQQLYPQSAIGIFAKEPDVILAGSQYLKSFSWDYIIVPFVFCCNGFLFGAGKTVFAAINGICSAFLLRVPLGFILGTATGATLFDLGIATPCASIVSGAVAIIYIRSGRWKKA